ncbi:MAG TPA: hypothetical protein VIH10_14615 [Kribbella sp.]
MSISGPSQATKHRHSLGHRQLDCSNRLKLTIDDHVQGDLVTDA